MLLLALFHICSFEKNMHLCFKEGVCKYSSYELQINATEQAIITCSKIPLNFENYHSMFPEGTKL